MDDMNVKAYVLREMGKEKKVIGKDENVREMYRYLNIYDEYNRGPVVMQRKGSKINLCIVSAVNLAIILLNLEQFDLSRIWVIIVVYPIVLLFTFIYTVVIMMIQTGITSLGQETKPTALYGQSEDEFIENNIEEMKKDSSWLWAKYAVLVKLNSRDELFGTHIFGLWMAPFILQAIISITEKFNIVL